MAILTSLVKFCAPFVNATLTLNALWIVKDIFAMSVYFPERVRKRRA